MKLLNCMLGRGLGGIEQAALDYHEVLNMAGHNVTSVIDTRAAMQSKFEQAGFETMGLNPLGEWDPLASRRLRRHAAGYDAIICHGNRALGVALAACSGSIPVIGVAHNYKLKKRFPKADAVFCITRDLIEECVHLDMPRTKLFHIPNMARAGKATECGAFRKPPVIGSFGRFVEKKGFDIFLQALHALKQDNVPFRAILGGDGELAPALQQQAEQLGLNEQLTFSGWVQDKEAFFSELDLFVLPSHHEPFGIALIEAMGAGLPCITTATEGPCEIITQHEDALMVDIAQPYAMAAAMRELLEDEARTLAIGRAARHTVCEHYDLPVVSARMDHALQQLLSDIHNAA